ncbi:MAG: hypothetical protein IJX71_02660, partial [Oscillospiraceae bacterium]|nr:hypothetical protein [Oscillospiraceae bacterium]
MKKKVISLLLVVAMLLPMLSSAGFAQETELPAESTLIAGEAEEAVPAEKAETGEEAPVAEEPAAEEQVVPTEEAPAEEPAEKSDQEADAELADVAVLSQSVEIDGIALAPAPPEDGGNTGGGNTGGGNTGGGNIGGGNTGGGNNGGGNVSTSTSVDHIDIAVDMTALIQIGNETVEHDFTIGTNDAGKVSISAAYGDGTAVSFTKGSVTTSTDNAGNAQIRLDGTYPVGTKDNPVYYTVTYTDTIQVSYKGETYDVKVTLQVTTNYWDSSNVCPGLDNNTSSWQGGAIINGSGIDLALGTGSGTVGFAQIQKKIIGAVPTENQTFQFKVYKLVNGEYVQYKNVDVVVEAGTTNATVAIANVPFGSYKVEEITSGMAPVGGHKWVEVSYTNQTFTLSADKANQLVIAENIYKTVVPGKITISKQFVGLDTATALPAAIDFTVKNAAGETVAAVTLDEANKWTADVEGLYAGTYTVVEDTADAAVAGYTLAAVEPIQVTLTEGSMGADYQIPVSSAAASFTNSYSKKEKSEEVPASFSIKKVDSATGEVLPEAVFTLTDENGNVVGSAATNTAGIAEFAGLNVAGKYTLTETTPPAGYVESIQEWEVVISANDNTVLQDDWFVTTTTYTVAITGLDDGVLTVKNVKNTTDVHNPASFTIQKVDQDGEALAGAEFTLYDEKGTVVKTVTTDTDGKAFFGGFSEAAVYTLEETKAPDGYVGSSTVWTVTVTLKDGDPQLVLNEEKNIFENIYNWILGITPDSSWANGVLTVSNVKVGTLTVTKTVEYVVNGQKANELPVGSEYVEDSYRFTVTIGGKAETIELKAGDSKTFQDIPYGTEYTVVENGTGNEAWTGSISGGTGTIGKDNQDAEVKAVNTYTYREDVNPVSFSVKKVDSDDQKPLDGAVFRLTDAEGGVVAETAVVNGIAQFGPFQKEAEYALTEIQAPVGYQLSNQVWTVKIRSDSVTTLDQENKVIVTTVTYTAESEGMEDGTLTITNDKDIREIHN